MNKGGKPGIGNILKNLSGPVPSGKKRIRLVLENLALRGRRGSACCGHPGEPGC